MKQTKNGFLCAVTWFFYSTLNRNTKSIESYELEVTTES